MEVLQLSLSKWYHFGRGQPFHFITILTPNIRLYTSPLIFTRVNIMWMKKFAVFLPTTDDENDLYRKTLEEKKHRLGVILINFWQPIHYHIHVWSEAAVKSEKHDEDTKIWFRLAKFCKRSLDEQQGKCMIAVQVLKILLFDVASNYLQSFT